MSTPDGTPRDANGEGRWRLQQAERGLSEVRSELTTLARDHAVHRTETRDFITTSKDRWKEEDRLRRERQKELDEWREEQERKTERIRKGTNAAVAFLATTALSGIVTVIILLAQR